MELTISIEERIQEVLAKDPLFQVIQETTAEQNFWSEPYLLELVEKKYYSTPEVAGWFDVTDAQLRYYIKPFESYLFEEAEDSPTTSTVIRLDFKAVLKLRMILLLKDEYRVKGLKRLLNISDHGHMVRQKTVVTTELAPPDDLAQRVTMLSHIITQMMNTGLFHIEQETESQQMIVSLNQEFLTQQIQAVPSETSEILAEITEDTQQLKSENAALKKQLEELNQDNKQDIAILIRRRHIENEVVATLRDEALRTYTENNSTPFFAKLFRSSQLAMEQERFILDYVQTHLNERLEKALSDYHES
ncbi:DNA primase [Solibacillus sp. FSL H8-0538]|uniref:DNA primase n=1 Tax=Solibacillus sp. FSL H8-0538 TaxID=2921400 RepID=UPI0030F8ECFE